MLNGFVLPIEQFDAARKLLSEFDSHHPLRVAALGPKTTKADVRRQFAEVVADGLLGGLSRNDVIQTFQEALADFGGRTQT